MKLQHRVTSFLNHRIDIKININKRISRNKALVLVAFMAVLMFLAGNYIGERWFWVNDQSLYEYRIASLRDQLAKSPKPNSIRTELAITYYLDGEADKAEAELRDVLADEPENDAAMLYLGLILSERKKYRESIEFLDRYLKRNRGLESRLAMLYLGRDYLETDAHSLALTTLREAAEMDPANPVVYYYLGLAYEKLHDRKNAIKAYEKALAINKNYTEAEVALNSLVSRMSSENRQAVPDESGSPKTK